MPVHDTSWMTTKLGEPPRPPRSVPNVTVVPANEAAVGSLVVPSPLADVEGPLLGMLFASLTRMMRRVPGTDTLSAFTTAHRKPAPLKTDVNALDVVMLLVHESRGRPAVPVPTIALMTNAAASPMAEVSPTG